MAFDPLRFHSSETSRTNSSVLHRLYQVESEVEELQYRIREIPSFPNDNYGSPWRPKPLTPRDKHRLPPSSIDLVQQDIEDLSRHVKRLECLVSGFVCQSESHPVKIKPRVHEQDRRSTQAKKKVHWWDQIEIATDGKKRSRRY